MPIGRISLRVSYIGYADAAIYNINLLSGKELVLNMQLEEMAIPVTEVIVKTNTIQDHPVNKLLLVSSRNFTVEETQRYAGSRGDVARMASNFAGVLGDDDFRNDIIIRGNSPVGFNSFKIGAEGPISRSNGSSFLINYRYSTLGLFEKLGMNFGTIGIPYYQDLSFKLNFPKTRVGNISVFGLSGISDIQLWDSKRDTIKDNIDFYGGEGFDLTNGSDLGVVGFNHFYIINPSTYTRLTLSYHAHRYESILDSLSKDLASKYPFYRNDFIDNALFTSLYVNHRFNSKSTLRIGAIVRRMGYNFADSVYKVLDDRFFVIRNDKGNTWLYQPYANWQIKPTNNLSLNV